MAAVPSCLGRYLPASCVFLKTSLKRNAGRPVGRRPEASWPYRMSWGMRPSSLRYTYTNHHIRCWQSMTSMLRDPACSSTAVLGTFSCHVMPRIRRRQRRFKFSRRFSCLAYVVQYLLIYSKNARVIHFELDVRRLLVVVPHSLAQLRHDSGGSGDAFGDFDIE